MRSASGYEVGRGDEPVVGVLPAHQRLDRLHLGGEQVQLGLVVQHDVPVVQSGAELAQQPEATPAVVVLADVVELDAAVVGLGHVHGGVGVLQEGGVVAAVVGEDGDAGAGLHVEAEVLELEGVGEALDDVGGQRDRLDVVDDAVEQHGELVAAEAGHDPGPRGDVFDAGADLLEEGVSGLMAERVVDLLEAVEIDEDDGQPGPVAPGPGDVLVEAIGEREPVGQVGERVVAGLEVLLDGHRGAAVHGDHRQQEEGQQDHAALGHHEDDGGQGQQHPVRRDLPGQGGADVAEDAQSPMDGHDRADQAAVDQEVGEGGAEHGGQVPAGHDAGRGQVELAGDGLEDEAGHAPGDPVLADVEGDLPDALVARHIGDQGGRRLSEHGDGGSERQEQGERERGGGDDLVDGAAPVDGDGPDLTQHQERDEQGQLDPAVALHGQRAGPGDLPEEQSSTGEQDESDEALEVTRGGHRTRRVRRLGVPPFGGCPHCQSAHLRFEPPFRRPSGPGSHGLARGLSPLLTLRPQHQKREHRCRRRHPSYDATLPLRHEHHPLRPESVRLSVLQ